MTDDHRKIDAKQMPGIFLRGRFSASLLAPAALALIVVLGAAFRLVDLGNRPMHCDEAVHAVKFGRLLEENDYVYDPEEYHGPSLNYLTLPIAWLTGKTKLTEITETDLRLVPALFGSALIGLAWFLRDELGIAAILWAALLTALSPAMVFYSRYYIQEMLLVAFTFGALIACKKGVRTLFPVRRILWFASLGVCLGMMHASKETCVIAMFSLAVATLVYVRRSHWQSLAAIQPIRWKTVLTPFRVPFLVVVGVAAGVSMLFFSSFFANPGGIADSVKTYFVYVGRASGEGSVGPHVYPWHYYLSHLFWFNTGNGPVWTELGIAVLAFVGMLAGIWGRGFSGAGEGDREAARRQMLFVRMLSVYTVLMTLVYCIIPYKTPWCVLGFLHGMILLAGVGAAVLIRVMPNLAAKSLMVVVLAAVAGHLAWQAHRASFVAFEDPTNPYVYSHTTSDVPALCRQVEQVARVHGDGHDMPIQVLMPDDDHWPLPWYLRSFTHVGWWSTVPKGPTAPLIILQPQMRETFLNYNYSQPPGQQHAYLPLPREQGKPEWQLRPNVPLQVYVRLKLRNKYLAEREQEANKN